MLFWTRVIRVSGALVLLRLALKKDSGFRALLLALVRLLARLLGVLARPFALPAA